MGLKSLLRLPRYRNVSVWHELTVGFSVVIALLLLVSGAALYQQQRSASAINRLLTQDGRLAELVLKTNALLFQVRRLEKDFYLSFKQIGFTEARSRYVVSFRAQLSDVRTNIRLIRQLAGDARTAERTRELEHMLSAYEYGFLSAVDLQSTLGHFDTGLAGELRSRAQALEQRILALDRPELQVIHLTTRRHEKDYMLRGFPEDVQRFRQTHFSLVAAVDRTGLDAAERQALLALSRRYLNAFNDYVRFTNDLQEQRAAYLSAVDAAEPLLKELHVAATARMEQTSATMLDQTGIATRTVILASMVAALIALFVSVLVARNVGRSVGKSMRFAEQIAAGDLDRHMELPDQKEFAVLAMALNKMADALRQSRIAQESRAVELERSVTDRTRQLAGANALLTAEVETRRAAEAQLQSAKEAAEQAASAKSVFLANISHEIRTPMNGILGLTELMLKTPMNGSQREFMEMIHASSQALLRLLNDILDYSKMEARKLTLDAIEFDLHDAVIDAVKPFAAGAGEKHLEFSCEIAPSVPRQVIGDPGRLSQVLVNLVGNAIKFTRAGEVSVRLALHHAQGKVATVAFEVADTGIGIEQSKQQHIFDAFAQADASTTRQFGGTGLGLAIVREMIKLMHGSISVESRPGQGTLFRFVVPLELAGQKADESSILPERSEETIVLVVDDHPASRRIVADMVRSFGATVMEASGTAQALSMAGGNGMAKRRCLALIDAGLPDHNGFELVRRLRAAEPAAIVTPIMMLSSTEPSEDMRRCAELEISHVLRKPFKRSELEAALRAALDKQGSEAGCQAAPETVADRAGRSLKVLVAEDHPINQRLILEILKDRGHQGFVAGNGKEVLAMLEDERFDAILMDGQMPEMDGYQATAAIRERERRTGEHVRIIAVTAHAMARDRDACLAAGMDDYLSKPIDAYQLIAKLEAGLISGEEAPPSPLCHDLRESAVEPVEEVFNTEAALRRTRGKTALLKEMMKAFRNELPDAARALKRTAQQHDADAVERGAHRIRGAAAALGAERLASAAARIEELGREGTFSPMPEAIAYFERCAAELEAVFDVHLREPA